MDRYRRAAFAFTLLALSATSLYAADLTAGMTAGKLELKSAGPLAFGPEGILFVADPMAASIVAIATEDEGPRSAGQLTVEEVDKKVAATIGTTADMISIVDLAISPASGAAYLSVARGRGPDAMAVLARVDASGSVELLDTDNIKFASTPLPNPVEPGAKDRRGRSQRAASITDLGFHGGQVVVAGLSNEEFSSGFVSIPFPFSDVDPGASVEIFHGSHGRLETASPIRTFVPVNIGSEPHLLAAYTCTPLVKIPLTDLKPGAHVQGVTVAELGNRNRPLDMVAYAADGNDYLLIANNMRGVMKVSLENVGDVDPIEERIPDKAGLTYDTIDDLEGVEQLDRFDEGHVALIQVDEETKARHLTTVALP